MICERCGNRCKKGVIIRMKNTCGDCFALLNADNKERMKKNIKLPTDLSLIINEFDYHFGSGRKRKRWKMCRIIL